MLIIIKPGKPSGKKLMISLNRQIAGSSAAGVINYYPEDSRKKRIKPVFSYEQAQTPDRRLRK